MRKCPSYLGIGILSAVGLFLVLWIQGVPLSESNGQRTHRLCRECGLKVHEVNWLIDVNRNTTQTRQESFNEILAGAYMAPSRLHASEAQCMACVEGILDEAGVK